MLEKKDFNPETHGNGSWRGDLYHKLQIADGNKYNIIYTTKLNFE
jgi:hypothetical protein